MVAAGMILPLAYAQEISSINPASPINHIVVIMQENRSFDNYFDSLEVEISHIYCIIDQVFRSLLIYLLKFQLTT
ncbi:MAG: alkaline phosphatase family protein [Candidatus Nitrosopolaris sp.]